MNDTPEDFPTKTVRAKFTIPMPAREIRVPSRLASRTLLDAMKWAIDQAAEYGQEYPYLTNLSVDFPEPPDELPSIVLTITLSRQTPVCGPLPVIHSLEGAVWVPRVATEMPEEVGE